MVPGIRSACHAHQVADEAASDRGGEPVVSAGEVTRHEAAIAVTGDREPRPICKPFGNELVDGLEEVSGICPSPAAERGGEELLSVSVAGSRVEQEDRPALGCKFLVVDVDLIGGAVPRVVRSAVYIQKQWLRTRGSGVTNQPALHERAVGNRELALLTHQQFDLV